MLKHLVAIQYVIYALVVFDDTKTLSVFTQLPHISVTLSPSDSGISN